MIAYLTGSGFYEMPGFERKVWETRFGAAVLWQGRNNSGDPIIVLPRHGEGHHYLPHQINHRANLSALADAGATAVVSLSVCGVMDSTLPLAAPCVAEDIYFPDNRLGDGSACSFFVQPGEAGRGHLLAASLLNSGLSIALRAALEANRQPVHSAIYAHTCGPRFNTRCEITALRAAGATILSQTCGPEAVLANELELPYGLIGFGVDYANGVEATPTPIAVLQKNLGLAKSVFTELVMRLPQTDPPWQFDNFVYRFD